jgi:proline iminopeptidase
MPGAGSPTHKIYWEEYGNPEGEPVMVLHGGPGGGSSPSMTRFFNPDRYRIFLSDQRGCGKSTPSAGDADPAPALTDNTTAHLVADIEALRGHFGVRGKMHVFGGSWGSTLALAYAQAHPQNVESIILRGVFLCRRKDLDALYQGNAGGNAADAPAQIFFPEAWARFVSVIPPEQRGDMVKAYAGIFASRPQDEAGRARVRQAEKAWTAWEGVTSYLAQDVSNLGHFSEDRFATVFSRIENHYFMNGAFFGGKSGEGNRDNNYILDNIARIRDIPLAVVHGRYDVVCPLDQAEALAKAYRDAGGCSLDYRVTVAGHSQFERETALALSAIMDGLPPMTEHRAARAAG